MSSPSKQTHISFHGHRASQSSNISGFFGSRLWLGPALTAALLLAVGWWTSRSVENAVKENLGEQLKALLNADVEALRIWLANQKSAAHALAEDDRTRTPIRRLVEISSDPTGEPLTAKLLNAPELTQLREHINEWVDNHGVEGFFVIDRQLAIIAHNHDMGLGDRELIRPFADIVAPIFEGQDVTLPPRKSVLALPDDDGQMRSGIPVMVIVVPVKDEQGGTFAALCLRIRPEREFTQILGVARAGKSGETYAFNDQGVMITNSRFDDDLKMIGLLPDDDETSSLLNVQVRDPGVDMTQARRPKQRRSEQPFTLMAKAAIGGEAGFNVDGYRDYRGVPVVGAWTWLPEYQFGVATEVDVAEAFEPLYSLRLAFGVLAGLLLFITLGLFGLTFYAARLEVRARRAALTAKRLGQYALGDELGSGGMGVVYRAHHDMLHRPTAVKLLHVEKTNEQTIARFEREVQLTSQLTHPNTIAIFDYGRTPEGVFYYAMEHLDGQDLDDIVHSFGPMPEARVIHVLRQLCGSLAEAHSLGLVHRDVKPANIMLTRYGGMCDFVKLLDFGLVKPQETEQNVTMAGSLTGTPLYLSPEAIRHEVLDQRSDLYAVGAVAYFMLTGQPVFQAKSIVDICKAHLETAPGSLSERIGRDIDADLEQLILGCLAKSKDDRPESANWLEEQLGNCKSAGGWTRSTAANWWSQNIDGSDDETKVTQQTIVQTMVAAPESRPDAGPQE